MLRIQFIVAVLLGLLLGYIMRGTSNDIAHGGVQNRTGAFFFFCCLFSFGSVAAVDLFFSERLLFLRERATGCYRTSSYFLAKAISDIIPMRVLPPIIMGSICYYLIGLRPQYNYFLYFIMALILVSTSSTALCMMISAVTPAVNVGNLVAIIILFLFLLFSGFIVNVNSLPAAFRWVPYTSLITYGFQILMINELNGLNLIFNVGNSYQPFEGQQFLTTLGINPSDFAFDIKMLVAMTFGYLFGAYLLLRFCVKEKR